MMTCRDPRMELRCWCSVLSETFLPRLGLKPQLCMHAGKGELPRKEHVLDACWYLLAPGSPALEDVLSDYVDSSSGVTAGHRHAVCGAVPGGRGR